MRIFVSTSIYSGDLNNHTNWGDSILKNGFNGAYSREYQGVMQPTYPPIALYAFTTSTGMYKSIYQGSTWLNSHVSFFPSKTIWILEDQDVLPAFNKAIAILADCGICILIYIFVRKLIPSRKYLALLASGMYGLNPAVWYVSGIWGQIESLPIFWVLLSYYLILKKRPYLSAAAFAAALLSKQTSIIFIPIYTILFVSQFNLKIFFKTATLQVIIFYLTYLPFTLSLNPLSGALIYFNRLQTGSGSVWITDHAFNLWMWYSHLKKIPDSTNVFANISASTIGTFAFLVLSILPLVKYVKKPFSWKRTFLISGYMPLIAFSVLTKMHERYSAPLLPFLALVAIFDPWFWPVYIIASLAHLINLYHEWYFPRILGFDTFVTQPWVIYGCSIIFALVACVLLYKQLAKKL